METNKFCKVVLVEDNPDDEALVQRALRNLDFPVRLEVARDGPSACEMFGLGNFKANAFHPVPALFILDQKLPGMHGTEILVLLRQNPRTADTPVVMFSSSDDPVEIAQALALGANGYVKKPIEMDRFMEAVRSILIPWCEADLAS